MRLEALVGMVLVAGLAGVGCGSGSADGVRRSSSHVSADAPLDSLGTITVLPCGARVDEEQDPDDIAPGLATNRLQVALTDRIDAIRTISESALEERDLAGSMAAFYRNWLAHPEEGDGEALKSIALRLQADTLLLAGVLEWKQTDKYTRVGMVAGLFDGATGRMLWWSEQERQATGQPEHGGPPDYVIVVDRVVEALVEAFSAHATQGTPE